MINHYPQDMTSSEADKIQDNILDKFGIPKLKDRKKLRHAVRNNSREAIVVLGILGVLYYYLRNMKFGPLGNSFNLISDNTTYDIEGLRDFKKIFKPVKSLGMGGFGEVWLYCNPKTNECMAVKIIKKRGLDKNERKNIENETKILIKLNDNVNSCDKNGIVGYYNIFEDTDNFYILMEHIDGVELFYLEYYNWKSIPKSNNIKLILLKQICKAISYLHKNDVVHMDLKPENIMITGCACNNNKKGKCSCKNKVGVKLIDFGLSCEIANKLEDCRSGGTYGYMPPEVLIKINNPNNKKVNIYKKPEDLFKADIFAFGVIIYKVFTGEYLFGELKKEIIENILNDTHLNINTGIPELDKIVLACIWPDFNERPTIFQVCTKLNKIK
jgi:serine/threonine protein kinase